MPRPFRPNIWLSESAFLSMVSSAVEAFDEETLGVLLGLNEPQMKRIVVQYAIVYQTAKRARDRVKANPKKALRLNKFLERITSLEVVGDFHSHPRVPVRKKQSCWLSQEDKDDMSKGYTSFVIAIDQDNTERIWKHLSLGSLLGSVFPYSLKISAWLRVSENNFKIARIHCPFALGLGR